MKNLVIVSLPKVELVYPPGALAILSSVAKENGYAVTIFDYNLDLFDELTEAEWEQLEEWNTFAGDHVSAELETRLKEIFIAGLESKINDQTEFVCFSVFSYFSNRIATRVLEWYKDSYAVKSIVGGTGVGMMVGCPGWWWLKPKCFKLSYLLCGDSRVVELVFVFRQCF